jgi:hypothetical protein
MGSSSISYKQNNIDFIEARKLYYAPSEEASLLKLFNAFSRPKFSEVIDIEEFDNGRYVFKFDNDEWFVVEAKSKHW